MEPEEVVGFEIHMGIELQHYSICNSCDGRRQHNHKGFDNVADKAIESTN
jgi:hypothetical protein